MLCGCGPVSVNLVVPTAENTRSVVVSWEYETTVESRAYDFSNSDFKQDVELSAVPEEGRVDIDVTYRIPATNSRNNLVYPFYLEGRNTG